MTEMNMIQSLNSALDNLLESDPNVIIFGQDIGYFGGVFRVTDGLQEKHGAKRVFDAPLAEGGIAAIAFGMGLNGLRPVMEIQFADYIFPAYDQIVNEMAKLRHRSGGEFSTPVTIRTPAGGGIKGGHHHSQSPESQFTHTPGIKVVYCSNPYNAKGLLISAIECNDPVVFLSRNAVTEAHFMATHTMSLLGKVTSLAMYQKNTIPYLLEKHISLWKVMSAPLLRGERWSMLQSRESKILASLVT